jgi:hypothetical protein
VRGDLCGFQVRGGCLYMCMYLDRLGYYICARVRYVGGFSALRLAVFLGVFGGSRWWICPCGRVSGSVI